MDAGAAARIAQLDQVLQSPGLASYSDRQRLRVDVALVLQFQATLQAHCQTFSTGNQSATLFYLSGVLPINYKGNVYNIPVTIYLDPAFPRCAPRFFVTPTPGMALRPNHPHVDQGGMLYHPYLSSWSAGSSTLSQAISIAKNVFAETPPVHATTGPKQSQPQPPPAMQHSHQQPPQPQMPSQQAKQPPMPVAVAKPLSQATPPSSFGQPASASPQPASASPPQSDSSPQISGTTNRASLEQTLAMKSEARWPVLVKPIMDDLNTVQKQKQELIEHGTGVSARISELQKAKGSCEEQLTDLQQQEAKLQSFLAERSSDEPLDVAESLRKELDSNAENVLDFMSEELAMEEYVMSLDELLAQGKVTLQEFMRETRDASRRQFLCQANRRKAMAALGQSMGTATAAPTAQALAPAPAAPQPAVPIINSTPPEPAAKPPASAPVAAAAVAPPSRRQLVAA